MTNSDRNRDRAVMMSESGRVPSWLGFPGALSLHLCRTMRDVLLEQDAREGTWLTSEASEALAALRDSYGDILTSGKAPLELQQEGAVWHTFAGGAINRVLVAGLEQLSGSRWISGNLSLRGKVASPAAAETLLTELGHLDWEHTAAEAARRMTRGSVSKFQPCLPQEMEDRLLAERLLDVEGARKFTADLKLTIVKAG
ncbi:hypothetical protein [Reyranella sp.]|uniref:hypothetical protein n=1 Tax=Reyranella sp. TaxID=1929291 RepID=UPI003D13D487